MKPINEKYYYLRTDEFGKEICLNIRTYIIYKLNYYTGRVKIERPIYFQMLNISRNVPNKLYKIIKTGEIK